MNVFALLAKYFSRCDMESTVLHDASKKILNQSSGYDAQKEEMNVKNMGWRTHELADIAGGVEENRELTDDEIESFFVALQQLLRG